VSIRSNTVGRAKPSRFLCLFAVALLTTPYLAAQVPHHDKFKVETRVSAQGSSALRSEVENCVTRELRSKGDVSITANKPEYRVIVAIAPLSSEGASTAGFVISYIFSSVGQRWEDPPNLMVVSVKRGQERLVCQEIASAFDTQVLEPIRATVNAIENMGSPDK
jgi:hypothetical protein